MTSVSKTFIIFKTFNNFSLFRYILYNNNNNNNNNNYYYYYYYYYWNRLPSGRVQGHGSKEL